MHTYGHMYTHNTYMQAYTYTIYTHAYTFTHPTHTYTHIHKHTYMHNTLIHISDVTGVALL